MKLNIISFLIGLAAGAFGGLAGLGGGLILIPLMLHVLKLSQHQVHGTTLVAIIFTGLSGAIAYGLNGAVDITAAALLAGSSISTASVGARYADTLPSWKLRKTFGIFLIFCAVLLFSKPFFTAAGSVPGWAKIIILLITGLVTGFLSGMMGVGGGAIMVPVMVLLAGFSQHVAQGTSLLVMVPAGVVGALTHRRLGNVVHELLWGLIPGLLLGAYLGGNFADLLPENVLRNMFSVVILWIGLRYARTRTNE